MDKGKVNKEGRIEDEPIHKAKQLDSNDQNLILVEFKGANAIRGVDSIIWEKGLKMSTMTLSNYSI